MMIPYSEEAHSLLHDGARALAQVENNGLRIDTEYLTGAIQKTTKHISFLQNKIERDDIVKTWKGLFGRKTNLNSNDQLGNVLFGELGYTSPNLTEKGKFQVDEKTLSTINIPFVRSYLKLKKMQRALGTYLLGIEKEVVDGYLHPFFNLHTTQTFRSSSDGPNFQNIPVRNEKIGKLIRKAFIAREGRQLVEIDYSGIEVCIAACYHKDPSMLSYIKDKTKDMHRDMAQECFLLSKDEMVGEDDEDKGRVKKIRYCGKNMFVFPQFYGDWYIDCARSLWEAIKTMSLTTRDGTCLRDYLKTKGIKELGDLNPEDKPRTGTFEKHIQEVEKRFWNERFPIYNQWKKNWVSQYQEKGFLLTKTGFICQGYMKRNEIINYPVQGSAFHCLLWSLNRLVLEELPKRNMKTLIVGQIHDSIVADVPTEELEEYISLAQKVMTKRLPKIWDWINVPLEIETEASPVNGCWADKKIVKGE